MIYFSKFAISFTNSCFSILTVDMWHVLFINTIFVHISHINHWDCTGTMLFFSILAFFALLVTSLLSCFLFSEMPFHPFFYLFQFFCVPICLYLFDTIMVRSSIMSAHLEEEMGVWAKMLTLLTLWRGLVWGV